MLAPRRHRLSASGASLTAVSRTEIRAAAIAVVVCVVVGAIGALVWGFAAPAEHLIVVAPDRGAPLTGESMHQFDAVAIFACIAAVIGILTAAAIWQWRAVRGPVLYAGLLIGSAVGAATMYVAGELVARLRFPHVDAPAVDQIITVAPTVGTYVVLLIAPLLTSFTVLAMAAVSARDDLGADVPPPPAQLADQPS
jgi:uncharacterized membrane protein YgdD (TMEM256/DUF423 family)